MALKPCICCGTLSNGSFCPRHARPGSRRQWRKTRQAVFAFYGPRCACGAPAEHVDHVIPVADGGTDRLDNLRPACAKCNLARAQAEAKRSLSAQERTSDEFPSARGRNHA
jgi:5-methylcytosine-specific restriction endonuclease McrA